MTAYPPAALDAATIALHQPCVDRWNDLPADVSRGVTMHGPDAHLIEARTVLAAIAPHVVLRADVEGVADKWEPTDLRDAEMYGDLYIEELRELSAPTVEEN